MGLLSCVFVRSHTEYEKKGKKSTQERLILFICIFKLEQTFYYSVKKFSRLSGTAGQTEEKKGQDKGWISKEQKEG